MKQVRILKEVPKEWDSEQTTNCKCDCNKNYRFYHQKDRNPEYYTRIYLECECGLYLKFEFPVN